MKIQLKRIKLENFRSFQSLEVDLSPGLYALKGRSGAGKTNLHLGIAYALGYSPFPSTELQSHFTKDKMLVELDLLVDNEPVKIIRGRENKFIGLGKEIDGASPVSSAVESMLKTSSTLVNALCLREQREKGYFLNMKDSGKKEFLSEILGLYKLEKEIDIVNSDISSLELDIEKLDSQIESLLSNIPKYDKPEYTPSPKIGLWKDSVLSLKKEIEEKDREIVLTKIELSKKDLNIANTKSLIREKYSAESVSLFNVKNSIELELTTLNQQMNKRQAAIKENNKKIADNASKLQKLNEKVCYTCLNPLEDVEKLKNTLECENISVSSLNSDIELNLEKNAREKEALINSLDETNNSIKELQSKAQKELKEALEALSVSFEKYNIDSQLRERQSLFERLSSLETAIETEKKLKLAFDSKMSVYEQTVIKEQQTLSKIEELKNKKTSLETKLTLYKNYLKFNKEFLTKIFSEILKEIEKEVNNILPKIANVKDVSFSFTTQAQTQSGKEKDTIEPIIFKNGTKVSIKSGLSGGQFASLEFAVDLAVAEVINRRTGLNFNWLILDEPFDGLGVEEKEACLEYLKTYVSHKMIMVIDHSSEIKEWFDKFYFIENDGIRSVLRDVQ